MGQRVGSYCSVTCGSPAKMGQNGGPPKLTEFLAVSLVVVSFGGL